METYTQELNAAFFDYTAAGMCSSWQALLKTRRHHELNLAEGLELLLQAEHQQRSNQRFERLQKNAQCRYQASVEELNMDSSRGLDRSLLTELATGNYLSKGEAILISGAFGAGNSFLASALSHQACAQGYKVQYYNLQKLLLKTKLAGSTEAFTSSWKDYHVLNSLFWRPPRG